MSNTWFSADHHFGHANIINNCKRPFTHVEEMNETMIGRWNEVVRPNDVVWYLGDMFFRAKAPQIDAILTRLNGEIHYIQGNHDQILERKFKHRFKSWDQVCMVTVNEQQIVLSHYAHRVWEKSVHGVWHLYGHSHGQLPEDLSLSFDVGVDAGWNYAPVSMDQIVAKMRDKIMARTPLGTVSMV